PQNDTDMTTTGARNDHDQAHHSHRPGAGGYRCRPYPHDDDGLLEPQDHGAQLDPQDHGPQLDAEDHGAQLDAQDHGPQLDLNHPGLPDRPRLAGDVEVGQLEDRWGDDVLIVTNPRTVRHVGMTKDELTLVQTMDGPRPV